MKQILTYIFLICLIAQLNAQNFSGLNKKKFEHIVKTKIDSIRVSKGLNILVNDSILYVAATDHSIYLDSEKKITHYQKKPNKKTPQLRVDFYGGINYSVGENIVEVSVAGKEEEMAQRMVTAWVNSPGHYANITTADYDITGLSVHFNPKKGTFVAVQKFAIVSQFYVINQNKELFPFATEVPKKIAKNFVKSLPKKHKRHAYRIKENKKEEICKNSNSDVFSNANINLDMRNDSLFVGIKKRALSRVKSYFKEKKDGLTLEFAMFKYNYSCDPTDNTKVPTRRNGRCEFDGPIIPPTYTKNILEQIKDEEEYNRIKRIRLHREECIWVNLGRFPQKVRGEKFEINLLVLKKNRICNIISALSVCGEQLINPLPEVPYLDNLTPVTYSPKLKPAIKRIRVNFEKNETVNTSNSIEEAINELRLNHHEIIKADIKAFASVEGSIKGNENLFIKRAEGVLKRFEANQDSSIRYKLKTEENWHMFFKQIDTTKLAYLTKLDTVEIRNHVNKNKIELEPFLSKQRYAYITLYTKPKLTNNNLIRFAKENFENIVKSGRFTNANINKLIEIQQFLFDKVNKNLLHPDSVSLYYPSQNEKLFQLQFNESLFNFKYRKNIGHRTLFNSLEKLNKIDHQNPYISFNLKAAFFNSNSPAGIKKDWKIQNGLSLNLKNISLEQIRFINSTSIKIT